LAPDEPIKRKRRTVTTRTSQSIRPSSTLIRREVRQFSVEFIGRSAYVHHGSRTHTIQIAGAAGIHHLKQRKEKGQKKRSGKSKGKSIVNLVAWGGMGRDGSERTRQRFSLCLKLIMSQTSETFGNPMRDDALFPRFVFVQLFPKLYGRALSLDLVDKNCSQEFICTFQRKKGCTR